MNLSDKVAMVVCHPLFIELAVRLGRDFKKVYVWMPGGDDNFPVMNKGRVGEGMEGIERVTDIFGPHFDAVDLFVFPDLYFGALQVKLEEMGKRVWGSRLGEELEIYRECCKEAMEEEGLPVQPWKVLKGMEALRAHLKGHKDQHVKINRWRGNFETFFAPSYDLVSVRLDEIAHKMGPFQLDAEFVVEDDLPDRVEIGLDCFCIDGQWPSKTLVGIEVKDLGYVAQFVPWAGIPEPIRRWNETMAPRLARYGYRGFLSTEVRIGEDKVPYMIDACCRAGSPPNELYQEFYTNLSELMWAGSEGTLVDPKPAGVWGVEVILKSAWAESNHQPIQFPPEYRHLVKLFNPVRIGGKYSVVPQDDEMTEIGAVIGYGATLDKAIAMAREAGESIEGYGIKFSMGPIEEAQKQIAELQRIGVSPFTLDK